METLTLISKEKLDNLQAEITQIKFLLQENQKLEYLKSWLSKKEARLKLKVCQKTFDNYLARGILSYSRFAGKIYILAADIEAHLQKHYIKAS